MPSHVAPASEGSGCRWRWSCSAPASWSPSRRDLGRHCTAIIRTPPDRSVNRRPPRGDSVVTQRFESSVTAVSWIPSEAISGPSKIPFEFGVTHYDEPPPDRLEDIEQLRTTDRFREANELRGFIEVEDGRIVRAGHLGKG